MGGAAERGRLHRQYGEDAGHQIQDQPAQQGEQGRLGEVGQGGGGGCLRALAVADRAVACDAGQGGARLGRDLPGAQIGGQDAADRSLQPIGRQAAPGGDGHGQALRPALARLGGGVVDHPALERMEIGPLGRGARQRAAAGRQHQMAVGQGDARFDPGGTRSGGDHVLDRLTEARVQRRRALAHRQVQRQIKVFGHAHLVAADVEVRGDAQGKAGARRGVRRYLDRDGQEDGAGIAVVHQALQPLTLGQGPQDVARRDARRQGPTQGRRAAGIALIAPIGVPAGLDLLADGDDGGRAGDGPGAHGDQLRLDPLGALGARRSGGLGDRRGPGRQGVAQGDLGRRDARRRRKGRGQAKGEPGQEQKQDAQGRGRNQDQRKGASLDSLAPPSHGPRRRAAADGPRPQRGATTSISTSVRRRKGSLTPPTTAPSAPAASMSKAGAGRPAPARASATARARRSEML